MIKRNSVVTDERDQRPGWTPFGRVSKIRDGLALVIFVTRDYDWIPVEKLEEYDYHGRWERYLYKEYFTAVWNDNDPHGEKYAYYVWLSMPSLRKLKQRASVYNPEIWDL